MIYTITCNPSIDYFIEISTALMETEVNRAEKEKMKAGGKGLNVSLVLNEMQIPSIAVALLGGFSAQFIKDYVSDKKYIELKEIPVVGNNRINVKIHNDNKTIGINGNGPMATKQTKTLLFACLKMLTAQDWVVISGSLAQNMSYEWLIEMAKLVHEKQAKLVMDMEHITLSQLKQLRPYLIKPNLYEFSLLAQQEITSENMMSQLAILHKYGVESVLLSLGENGALYSGKEGIYQLLQPSLEAYNLVGCGDAMLAAFIAKRIQGCDIMESLRWGGAAGLAAVSTLEDVKLAQIKAFLKECKVKQIEK